VSSAGSGRSISGGPKPLLLSTSSVTSPQTERRKPWSHITRDSVSSTSSLSPTDYRSKRRTDSIGWDSDTTRSRVVPIRHGTGRVSPAAVAAKISRSRPDSTSSERSEYLGKLSEEPNQIVETKPQPPIPEEGRINPPSQVQSPPPKTPSSSTTHIPEKVHVQDAESQRGSLVLDDILEDGTPIRAFLRRKTRSAINKLPEEPTSDASTGGARIRHSQRVKPRRQLLRIQTATEQSEQTTGTSPNTLQLPEWPHTVEEAPTPRASGDGETRPRKTSGENRESTRPRKVSGERIRKASGDSIRRNRESSSMEGDDEGYDDLLSAYESEEGLRRQ
jgi:hypothetical protein